MTTRILPPAMQQNQLNGEWFRSFYAGIIHRGGIQPHDFLRKGELIMHTTWYVSASVVSYAQALGDTTFIEGYYSTIEERIYGDDPVYMASMLAALDTKAIATLETRLNAFGEAMVASLRGEQPFHFRSVCCNGRRLWAAKRCICGKCGRLLIDMERAI